MSPITLSLLLVIILGRYSAAPEKPLSNKSLTRYSSDKLLENSKRSGHEPKKLIASRHENDVIKTITNRIQINKSNFNKHAEISNNNSFQSNPQTDWILQQSAQINRSHENSTGEMRRTRVHYFNEINTKPVKGNENSIKETQLENTNLLSENREIKRLSLSFTNEINGTVLDRVSRGPREDFKLKGETTVMGKTRGELSRIKHLGAEFSPEILGENEKFQRNIHDNRDNKTILKNISLNTQSTNAKNKFVKHDLLQNNKDITDINNSLLSEISKDLNYDQFSTTIKHEYASLIRDNNGRFPRDSNKFEKTELRQIIKPEFKNTKMEKKIIDSDKLQEYADMVNRNIVDNILDFKTNNVYDIETKIDSGDIDLHQNMFQMRVKLVDVKRSRVTRESEDGYQSEKKLKSLDELDLVTETSTTVKYSDGNFEEESTHHDSNHDTISSFKEFQDKIFKGKRLLNNYNTHFSQLRQDKAAKIYNEESLAENIEDYLKIHADSNKFLENLKPNQKNMHVKDSQVILDEILKDSKFDFANVREVEIPRLRRNIRDVTKGGNNVKSKNEELLTENHHVVANATIEKFNYLENITESFEQTDSNYEVTTENKIRGDIDLLSKHPKEVDLSITTTQVDSKKNDNLTMKSLNKNDINHNIINKNVSNKELVSNIEVQKLNNTQKTNVSKSEMKIENNTYVLFHNITTKSEQNSNITNKNETSLSNLSIIDNQLDTIKNSKDDIIRSNSPKTNINPTAAYYSASHTENFKANENFIRKLGEKEDEREVFRQVSQTNPKESGNNKINKKYKTEGQTISNILGNTLKSDGEKNIKLDIENNKFQENLDQLEISSGDVNKISFGIVHIELNSTIVANLSGKSIKTEKNTVERFNGLQEKNVSLDASNYNLNLYPDFNVNETDINEKYARKPPKISKYYNLLVDKTKHNNPKIQINNKLVPKPPNANSPSHKPNNKNPLGNTEAPSRNVPATGYLNNTDNMEKSHELYFRDEILNNQPFYGFPKIHNENLGMDESETVSVKANKQDDIIMSYPNENRISSTKNSANISPATQLIKLEKDLKFRKVLTVGEDNKFEQNENIPINKLTLKINGSSMGGEQQGLVNRDGLGIKRPMIKRSRSSIVPSVLSNENASNSLSTATSSLTNISTTEPANSIRNSPMGYATQSELPATTSQIPGDRSIAKSENSSTLFTTPSSVLPQVGKTTLETSLDSSPVPTTNFFNTTNLLDYASTEKNYTDFSDIFPSSPYTILLKTTLPSINLTDNLSKQRLDATNASIKATEFPWPVKREAVVEGDIVLGGLMMVHEREDSVTCGPVMPQGGIQALEAMLYTLDMLNDGPDQLLPNITLGAHILDDCDKDTYGLEMAVDFIKDEVQISNKENLDIGKQNNPMQNKEINQEPGTSDASSIQDEVHDEEGANEDETNTKKLEDDVEFVLGDDPAAVNKKSIDLHQSLLS